MWSDNKTRLILLLSFLGGGVLIGFLAFVNMGGGLGFNQVTIKSLIPPILVGSLSATTITYFLLRNRILLLERLEVEQRFRQLFENAAIGMTMVGLDGQIRLANDTFCRMIGYSLEELIVKTIADITHPDDIGGKTEDWQKMVAEKNRHSTIEKRYIHKDGHVIWGATSRAVVKDVKGKPVYSTAQIQDISDSKRSAKELNLFQATLDQTKDCVFMFDPDTLVFLYINQGALEQVGYSKEELLKLTPVDIKPELNENQFRDIIKPLVAGSKESIRFETIHQAKNGSKIPVDIILQYVTPEDEPPRFVAIVRDITDNKNAQKALADAHNELELRVHERTTQLRNEVEERKKIEASLVEANQQAENANRTKTDFLANMSHELRTPLNAILGFSDLIRTEAFGPLGNEKYKDYIGDIHNSGQHLLKLINDILDVSVIEAGKIALQESDFHLDEAVEASLLMVKGRAEFGGVELVNSIDGDAPILRADELRIKQILVNLLSNAVKFTPTGGTVTVTTDLADDNSAFVKITDTGIGMDAADLTKAMEKFGQTERGDLTQSGEGTGLGLPLTKGLVEAHGGTLEIESKRNKGTTVTVRLPQERVLNS